jgi:alkyl hydroperoxide reductase subunit F
MAHPNVEVILNADTKKILHDDKKQVHGLVYLDKKTNTEKTLAVQGVFVEIGVIPNSEIVKDILKVTQMNSIIVDPRTPRTSDSGIWAAGDVTDALYRQNNISSGDAIKAILNIYEELHVKSK